ncbi:MAG: hypothetical protein FJZ92_12450, partial [Chloroflexi bacterium]|nr:hypothetical protein [Chloroflexota bacterium]
MLVGSNDGFVGVDSEPLFTGTAPRTITLNLAAWDAGTEANSGVNSGFAGGQPDPARGAANLDNGTATSEAIAPHAQFGGTQATLRVTPVIAPAATGNAGLAAPAGAGIAA